MAPLVARCPNCGAAFRVVADQLRLRDGKVRCGVCHTVFDGRANTVVEPPSQTISAQAPAAVSIGRPQAPPRPVPIGQREPVMRPITVQDDDYDDYDELDVQPIERVSRHSLRNLGRSSMRSAFWSVGLMIAVVALLLQTLWWWRTPIATYVPFTRVLYERVCGELGCEAGYVRVPGLLTIESSTVQPDTLAPAAPGVQRMTLTTVVRNRASHPQPWPALELELTDFTDVAIVRRVIGPPEYLGADAPPYLAAGSEREIVVSLAVRGERINGYRLALFFP